MTSFLNLLTLVSKVSIYNYFESKYNLRRVLTRKIMDDDLEQLIILVNGEDTIMEKLVKYLDNHKPPYPCEILL